MTTTQKIIKAVLLTLALLLPAVTSFAQLHIAINIQHDEKDNPPYLFTQDAEISPDGKYVITCGSSMSVILWEMENGEKIRKYSSSTAAPFSISFSPNGTRIAAGLTAQGIKIWDFQSAELQQSLIEHSFYPGSPLQHVTFSPDGKNIIAKVKEHPMYSTGPSLWDLESGELLYIYDAPTAVITDFEFSKDGSKIFANSSNKGSYLLDAITGEIIDYFSYNLLPGHMVIDTDFRNIMALSAFQGNLTRTSLVISRKSIVDVISFKQVSHGFILDISDDNLISVTGDIQSSPDGDLYILHDLIDTRSGNVLASFDDLQKYAYNTIKFSQYGNYFIGISKTNGADIYDLSNVHIPSYAPGKLK
jgi:WD40 repeat protein